MSNFIFRDIFPKISPNIDYCTNIYAAWKEHMEDYKEVHRWLNDNQDAWNMIYSDMPHFGFNFSDASKETEFTEKFEKFMAPVEVDGESNLTH